MRTTPETSRPALVIPADMEGLLESLALDIDTRLSDEEETWALCPSPNHKDSKASWSINTDTGLHSCFSCGYKGNLLGLVLDVTGRDVFEANRFIRGFGVDLEKIIQYLAAPASTEPEAVRTFSEDALDVYGDPPAAQLQERSLSLASCRRYDVVWDQSDSSWILPVRAPQGALVGYQVKRKGYVRNRPIKIKKSHCLFGLDQAEPGAPLVLVESPLDVVRLHTAGVPNGVSSFGVVVSEEQMKLVITHTDRLVLALDNDSAGKKRTQEILTGVSYDRRGKPKQGINWAKRLNISVLDYAALDVKDPGDMTDDQIHHAIDTAIPAVLWSA